MTNLQIHPLENDWGIFIDPDLYNNNKYQLFTIYEDDEYNNVLWADNIIDYFLNKLIYLLLIKITKNNKIIIIK